MTKEERHVALIAAADQALWRLGLAPQQHDLDLMRFRRLIEEVRDRELARLAELRERVPSRPA